MKWKDILLMTNLFRSGIQDLKIMADPFVGAGILPYYSGTMNSGSYVLNATKDRRTC